MNINHTVYLPYMCYLVKINNKRVLWTDIKTCIVSLVRWRCLNIWEFSWCSWVSWPVQSSRWMVTSFVTKGYHPLSNLISVTCMLVARQNVAETIGMLWQRDRSSVLQKTYSIIIALCIAQRGAGLCGGEQLQHWETRRLLSPSSPGQLGFWLQHGTWCVPRSCLSRAILCCSS